MLVLGSAGMGLLSNSRSPHVPGSQVVKSFRSQLLCDAVRCRVEDGDATAEDWTDSNGKTLAADRFWNSGIETMIAGDEEGPCLGIQLNIWERAKVIFSCYAL